MKSSTIIAGLIAGVVSFFLGWLVFGILLEKLYQAHTIAYAGLNKAEPVMWALIVGNLTWGMLAAYVLDLGNANSIGKGFICGFILFGLITLGFDMFFLAFMNLMSLKMSLLDIAINAIFGGVIGAVVGWWYSRGATANN